MLISGGKRGHEGQTGLRYGFIGLNRNFATEKISLSFVGVMRGNILVADARLYRLFYS